MKLSEGQKPSKNIKMKTVSEAKTPREHLKERPPLSNQGRSSALTYDARCLPSTAHIRTLVKQRAVSGRAADSRRWVGIRFFPVGGSDSRQADARQLPSCVWLCEKIRRLGKLQQKGEREWEWRGRSRGEMEGGGRERSPSLMWALITCQRSMIHLQLHTHTHTHYTANVWWHNVTSRIWVFCLTAKSLLCHGPIPAFTHPLPLS